jgi:hypothetical protein
MSDDFTAICHTCRIYIHFGQRMGGIDSFSLGHGGDTNNPEVKKEKQEVIEFCMRHAWCNPVLGVQILLSDPFMDNIHHGKYQRVRESRASLT